jgi:hypothetical protein
MKNLIKINYIMPNGAKCADGKVYELDHDNTLKLLFNTSRNAYIKADGNRNIVVFVSAR